MCIMHICIMLVILLISIIAINYMLIGRLQPREPGPRRLLGAAPRRQLPVRSGGRRRGLGIHQRGVQGEGGAVDGGSII